MTARYRKKETFKCTQWFKVGDHPAVTKIPKFYKAFTAVQHGAIGFLQDETESNGAATFIYPGNWVVERNEYGIDIYNDEFFRELFEIV